LDDPDEERDELYLYGGAASDDDAPSAQSPIPSNEG
jgi:hypothetical protein